MKGMAGLQKSGPSRMIPTREPTWLRIPPPSFSSTVKECAGPCLPTFPWMWSPSLPTYGTCWNDEAPETRPGALASARVALTSSRVPIRAPYVLIGTRSGRSLGRQLFLRQSYQLAEAVRVANSHVGEHLAVHLHVRVLQAVHELAVGEAQRPRCCADAEYP